MKKYIKHFLVLFILLLIGASFVFGETGDKVNKEEEEEEYECSCDYSTYTYYLYSCVGDCPGKILEEEWEGCSESCCDNESPCAGYPHFMGSEIVAVGKDWQGCFGGSRPYFACSGKCLSNVSDVTYYNNPNLPDPDLKLSESSSNSVKLPFKMDWEEDTYWYDDTGNCGGYFDCPKGMGPGNGSQSYVLRLEIDEDKVSSPIEVGEKTFSDYISKNFEQDKKEIEQGYFEKLLSLDTQPKYIEGGSNRSSEYNFRVDHNPCWLKSNEDYNVTIQTCCNTNGTNCNSGGVFNFVTSYAPELKSPEDLDWSGPNYSAFDAWEYLIEDEDYELDVEGRILEMPSTKYDPFDWEENSTSDYPNELIKFPVILDWCDVDDVNGEEKTDKGAFLMKLYQIIEDEEVPYSKISDGKVSLPAKPAHAGASWVDVLTSNYYDKMHFTENEKYSWELGSCLFGPFDCKDYGVRFSFQTENSTLSTDFRILHRDGDVLGIPTTLNWVMGGKVNSVKYELVGVSSQEKTQYQSATFNDLKLNTNYTFKVIPCSDFDSLKCEEENTKTLNFKTTGASPIVNKLEDGQYIPLKVSFKSVPGAKSYKYSFDGKEKVIESLSETFNYPEVKSDSTYTFKVKSCADKEGLNCGEYSAPMTFKTFEIGEVLKISTEENNDILYSNDREVVFKEVKGANYYKYGLIYSGDDTSKTCTDLKDDGTLTNIIGGTSFVVGSSCPGTYGVSITACLDSECNDSGETNSFSFVLDSKKAPEGTTSGGLVPCNRQYDDPTTAWDETQQCSLSHAMLLIRLLFDFLLGRLIPAAIVILLLLDGGLYLFHMFINFDNPAMDLIQKSKQLWKAVGIGALIIFLAWTAINFFLLFLDTKMSVYSFLEQFLK